VWDWELQRLGSSMNSTRTTWGTAIRQFYITFALKIWIYSHVTDMLETIWLWEFHICVYVISSMRNRQTQKTIPSWTELCTNKQNTHSTKHLTMALVYHVLCATTTHIWRCYVPSDFRWSSSNLFTKIPSWNPSAFHYHKEISGLFQGKTLYLLEYLCISYHFTCVKSCYQFLVLMFLKMCHQQIFWWLCQ
jgi:hypothetical protein